MPESHNQKAFHAGEWAPQLYARVDLQKYHSAAALLENFFVDYRGGASNRTGTKYILQAIDSSKPVRLIPFTASFDVSYVLEFGDGTLRFYADGAPVVETATTITNITQDFPASVTDVAHGYLDGNVIFITGVVGMTEVNDRFFKVVVTGVDNYLLFDLNGNGLDTGGYTAYVSGGSAQRVYTIASPYAAEDLALLKFAQNVNTLIICHGDYVPYILTLIAATNWTLNPAAFGATISAPTGIAVTTTLAVGTVNYSYTVTTVDANGQESPAGTAGTLLLKTDITTVAGTNTITWNAVSGAQFYNVYKATRSYAGAVPAGASHGYIGFTTGVSFADTNIASDFAETPPIPQNPFFGAPVDHATVTAPGAYTTVPTVTFGAPSSGATATGSAFLGYTSLAGPTLDTTHDFGVGDRLFYANGIVLVVSSVNGGGGITGLAGLGSPGTSNGFIGSGSTPANPLNYTSTNSVNGGGIYRWNFTYGVMGITIINGGSGYTSAPAVTFSAGAATATSTLGTASAGNPRVPAYFQQRLVLAAQPQNPQGFYMSQPGSYFNFDVSNPIQADDAISGSIVSNQLNEIKSMIPMPGGLVTLGDRQAWQINGGGAGTPITPIDATAQPQAYNGASDVPPLVVNYDILYVQSKGSIVRDLSYNFYTNIYTGTDISIFSSQLFFGFTITEWAYAEEPFKVIWAVRDDGTLLALTFLKEQELQGWAHSVTEGSFKSVCSITEQTSHGSVDAIYVVVERDVNGNTVQYVERMMERFLNAGPPDESDWFVDAGAQYSGAPSTTFTGAEHLAGLTVTGLADGVVITPFVMPTNGFFTLSPAASEVTIGIGYQSILKTMILDMGEPTVTGKLKKIIAATIRGVETLGIEFGRTLASLVPLRDFSGTTNSQGVTLTGDLVTTDAYEQIDPLWDQDGQYYIVQNQPLPVTITGVVPVIKVEDRK